MTESGIWGKNRESRDRRHRESRDRQHRESLPGLRSRGRAGLGITGGLIAVPGQDRKPQMASVAVTWPDGESLTASMAGAGQGESS